MRTGNVVVSRRYPKNDPKKTRGAATQNHRNSNVKNVLKGKVGSVAVDCVLGADGVPQATLVSPADTGLDTVALRIVRDSSWLPALRNGQPVEYRFRVVVTFSLVSR